MRQRRKKGDGLAGFKLDLTLPASFLKRCSQITEGEQLAVSGKCDQGSNRQTFIEKPAGHWQCHVLQVSDSGDAPTDQSTEVPQAESTLSQLATDFSEQYVEEKHDDRTHSDVESEAVSSDTMTSTSLAVTLPVVKSEGITLFMGHWRSKEEIKELLQDSSYQCKLCNHVAYYEEGLNRHIAIKHKMSEKAYCAVLEKISEKEAQEESLTMPLQESGSLNDQASHFAKTDSSKITGERKLDKEDNKESSQEPGLESDDCLTSDINKTESSDFASRSCLPKSSIEECSPVCDESSPQTGSSSDEKSAVTTGLTVKRRKTCSNANIKKDSLSIKKSRNKKSAKCFTRKKKVGSPRSLVCTVCGQNCESQTLLNMHLKKLHSAHPQVAAMMRQKEETKLAHTKYVSKISIMCPVCKQSFWGMRVMSHLKRWHPDAPNFSQLMKEVTSVYHKKKNEQKKESGGYAEMGCCSYCGKEMRKTSLSCHEKYRCKLNNSRQKLYCCGVCGFGSTFHDKYMEHLASHGQENFICDTCGRPFKTRGGLNMHRRTFHGMVLKAPLQEFSCDQCNQKFKMKGHLKKHLKIHAGTQEVCTECGKAVRDKYSLTRHILVQHMKYHPFQCPHCSRGFARKASLESHRCLIHEGLVAPSSAVMTKPESTDNEEGKISIETEDNQVVYLIDMENLTMVAPEILESVRAPIKLEVPAGITAMESVEGSMQENILTTEDKDNDTITAAIYLQAQDLTS